MRHPILILALALAGCASAGTMVTPQQAAQFKPHQNTCQQVRNVFGQPDAIDEKNGKSVMTYMRSDITPNAASYVPVIGYFAGTVQAKSHKVEFVCGKSGIIESISTGDTNLTSDPVL